jgi:NAD(P)-dependent dehydrogenase (short-subunit alcohol dehydrogenase family)
VEAVRLDFDDPPSVEAASRDLATIVGDAGLAGLVNMAGIIIEGPLEAVPPQAIRRQFEINVIGPVTLTQALLPMVAPMSSGATGLRSRRWSARSKSREPTIPRSSSRRSWLRFHAAERGQEPWSAKAPALS